MLSIARVVGQKAKEVTAKLGAPDSSRTLDWHGILIQVTLERQRFVDHLQIETLDPQRAPLPITETGYRSHFISKDVIEEAGGPANYVQNWLDRAASGKGWYEQEAAIRQYALL